MERERDLHSVSRHHVENALEVLGRGECAERLVFRDDSREDLHGKHISGAERRAGLSLQIREESHFHVWVVQRRRECVLFWDGDSQRPSLGAAGEDGQHFRVDGRHEEPFVFSCCRREALCRLLLELCHPDLLRLEILALILFVGVAMVLGRRGEHFP